MQQCSMRGFISALKSYYGLRDYGTAQWEGGDAGCDHQVGHIMGNANKGNVRTVLDTDLSYCGKCGARRIDQQIGLEETPEQYVAKLVDVFREVWRVLRSDGTLWLNLGDSYVGSATIGGTGPRGDGGAPYRIDGLPSKKGDGLKPKDMIGIPWLVAFALRADGWYLRSEIIWHKPNPMPESVTDRPTKAHEQLFLLAKSPTYFYDADAIAEQAIDPESYSGRRFVNAGQMNGIDPANYKMHGSVGVDGKLRHGQTYPTRNRRSVWTVATHPYAEAHFATYPALLVEPCILAGTSERGCCSACGAPWVRVVERQPDNTGYANGPGGHKRYQNVLNGGNGSSTLSDIARYRSSTLDWRPSCSCNAGVVPCTVLDPFNGAATTGIVALKHGRRYIGIDLNPTYLELSRRRIEQVQPMLFALPAQDGASGGQ